MTNMRELNNIGALPNYYYADHVYMLISQWNTDERNIPEQLPFIDALFPCIDVGNNAYFYNDSVLNTLASLNQHEISRMDDEYWIRMWMSVFGVDGLRLIRLIVDNTITDITDDDIHDALHIVERCETSTQLFRAMTS